MDVNIAIFISTISIVFTIFNSVVGYKRSNRNDTQNDTATITTILVKLENIDKSMSDIKTEMKVTRRDFQELRDKVIISEQALKTIWSAIENLEQRLKGIQP